MLVAINPLLMYLHSALLGELYGKLSDFVCTPGVRGLMAQLERVSRGCQLLPAINTSKSPPLYTDHI